jgi:membrane protein YqaA with SNARE-associated domain
MKTLWITVKLTEKQALILAAAAESASGVGAADTYVLGTVARRLRRTAGECRKAWRTGRPVTSP